MSAPVRAIGIGAEVNPLLGDNSSNVSPGAGGGGPPYPSHGGTGSSSSSGVQQGTLLTRTLYVNITGTLANLAMAGPSGGTWKLVDGKGIGVFGMGAEVDSQVNNNNNDPTQHFY